MATIPGTYEVSIPELNDAANIQDAFKLYHVGSTASNATPTSNSLAGYLSAIQTKLNDVSVNTANTLSDAQDLNALITSGLYYRTTAPLTNKNYPTITGTTSINPGYLTVTRSGSYVIQAYITFTVPESNLGVPTVGIDNQNTAYFWRSGTVSGNPAAADWNKWEQATTSAALKVVIDSVATKQPSIATTATVYPMLSSTALTASRVLTTDSTGLAAVSAVTTTELSVLSGGLAGTGVGSLGAALTGKASSTHTHGNLLNNGTVTVGVTPTSGTASKIVALDSGSNLGFLTASTIPTTQFLRGDGIWAVPTANTYTAGTGISVNGTVIANTGVTSVNGQTGAVTVSTGTGGVTSWNGLTGAVNYTAPVTSVNGQTGAVSLTIPKIVGGTATVTMSGTSRGSGSVTVSGLNSIISFSLTSDNPAINVAGTVSGTTISMTAGHIDGSNSSATINVSYIAIGT